MGVTKAGMFSSKRGSACHVASGVRRSWTGTGREGEIIAGEAKAP